MSRLRSKPKRTTGIVFAHRTRVTKANAWMPDRCVLRFDGEPDGWLLLVAGWSISESGEICWPLARLRRQLADITKQWHEDHGKSWRLEIFEKSSHP